MDPGTYLGIVFVIGIISLIGVTIYFEVYRRRDKERKIQQILTKIEKTDTGELLNVINEEKKFPEETAIAIEKLMMHRDDTLPHQTADYLKLNIYIKKLKNWAKWIIFWSIINSALFALVWAQIKSSLNITSLNIASLRLTLHQLFLYITYALKGETFLFTLPFSGKEIFFLISFPIDIVAGIAGILCLSSKSPWHGFYVVFSLYLISVGIFNFSYGSVGEFARLLGILQIGAGLWSISYVRKYYCIRSKVLSNGTNGIIQKDTEEYEYICANCGATVNADDKVCIKCGDKLDDEVVQ